MGVGMPTCTAACCLPDNFTMAGKTQDDVFDGGHVAGNLHSALGPRQYKPRSEVAGIVGVADELREQSMKENMLVFRDNGAPSGNGPDLKKPSPPHSAPTREPIFHAAADSCTMLNDLDFLSTPEWQTMPQPTPSALEEKLLQEAETAPQESVYPIALRSLWHNCPDALEVALRRVDGFTLTEVQASDRKFMEQKLEFTRIRQRFVAHCIAFRSSGPPSEASKAALQVGVSEVEERCSNLMAAQPDEQKTQLPGLIQKRDTLMLLTRIRTIARQLLALHEIGTSARSSAISSARP